MRGSLETIQLDSCEQKLQVNATITFGPQTINTKQQNGMSEHLLHCMLLLHSVSITSTVYNS